ncbi:MAG: DUF3450 domain-containing protein [Gammaproteobacteria bacterium]|nr:DUF3450 domain-containing protein [Gammaproteobacteria bacterium]
MCAAACPQLAAQETALFNATVQEQAKSDQASARSQIRIGQLADQTTELLADYRLTLQQLDRIRIYNDNLAALVADQEAEKASITQQLEDFVVVEQGIVPLMYDMIESLTQFISLDMPFQLGERTGRAARLADNMDKADITISEKYRQIMDAYLIETDFGRSTEAYTGNLKLEGVDTQVDFLRVGRVLLAYQTQDRAQTGFWNKRNGEWEALPDSYRNAVTQGLRIARKQAAPNLLRLPVPAPEAAR